MTVIFVKPICCRLRNKNITYYICFFQSLRYLELMLVFLCTYSIQNQIALYPTFFPSKNIPDLETLVRILGNLVLVTRISCFFFSNPTDKNRNQRLYNNCQPPIIQTHVLQSMVYNYYILQSMVYIIFSNLWFYIIFLNLWFMLHYTIYGSYCIPIFFSFRPYYMLSVDGIFI